MRWFTHISCVLFATLIASPSAAKWRYDSDKDPFTDERASTAIKTNPGFLGASLVVRCKDGFLESYFVPGQYLGTDDYSFVRFRFDDEEPESGTWSISTAGKAVFAHAPVEFARRLAAGNKLVIDAEDFAGTKKFADFSLSGSAAAINRVLADCRLMVDDPRSEDATIWRRVVQDLDDLDVKSAISVGRFLDVIQTDHAPHGDRRNTQYYRSASNLYLGVGALCRQGDKLVKELPSCKSLVLALDRNKDADYPVEVVKVIGELAEVLSESSE